MAQACYDDQKMLGAKTASGREGMARGGARSIPKPAKSEAMPKGPAKKGGGRRVQGKGAVVRKRM